MADKQKPEKVDQQIPAADTDIGNDPQLDTGPQITSDRAASPSEPDPDKDGTLVRPPKDLLPFLILSNRYDIVKELGKGGMGVVLLAKDRSLDRHVAIKRILVPDPSSLARFITEARSIAALNHFNIVQIHEIARDSEGPFLVLEYVDGGSLLDRLKAGALDIEDAIQITCQMCDALTLAHNKGIIHRDVKPANILLTENGYPKLTDFGLARDLESGWGQTSTGAGMGTPHYVPPEQWRDATSVDARSDLWSLAVTCYQMITGKNPKVIRLDQLPATLAPVIGTMLEDNPDKRYANAEEFKAELRNAMAASDGTSGVDLATGVCPACNTANNTSRKFCRGCRASLFEPCLSCEASHPIWEDICGECGTSQHERRNEIRTFLSTSLEESLSFAREYKYQKALVQLATVQEDQHAFTEDIREQAAEQVKLITSQRDEQYQLKGKLVQLAQQHLQKYDYAGAVRELKNIPAPLRKLDNAYADGLLINAEMNHVELSRLREEIQQPQQLSILLEKATRYLQLKPDDKNIIAFFEQLNAREGRTHTQIETLVAEAQTAFDSHQDESVLKLLNSWPDGLHRPPRAGELQELAHDRLGRVRDIKLSIAIETTPSKKRRLVQQYLLLRPGDTQANGLLLQLDEETKGEGKQIKLIAAGLIAAGLLLALTVFLVHSSIKPERDAREKAAPEGSMGGDQEGQVLPEDELEEDLTEAATRAELERLAAEKKAAARAAADKAAADKAAAEQAAAAKAEEERMAAGKAEQERIAKEKAVNIGQLAITLERHSDIVSSVSFSPDGRRIVSGSNDKTVKVWDAETGQELLTLTGHSDWVRSGSFSPDGRRIVSGGFDDTLKVWDAETGQELLTLKGHTDAAFSVSFSPDGRRIVSGSFDNTLKVWDAETGQETRTLRGHSHSVYSVSFSPDGKRIVSGSSNTLKVWDAETGQELHTLEGHSESVYSVSFSPDGRWIVSGSGDKTLKVWDAETGQEMLTLKGHSSGILSVDFSPDGKRIVSGSLDNTLKIWDLGQAPTQPAARSLPANLQQGLVAYYPFNGNAEDQSGNGHHATMEEGIFVKNRDGKQDSAISLSDNQQVLTPDLGLTIERSVTAWIFPKANSKAYVLTQLSSDQEARWHFTINQLSRKAVSYHSFGQSDNAPYEVDLPLRIASPGLWCHVAFVHSAAYDGPKTRFYIYGILIGAASSGVIDALEGQYHVNGAFTHLDEWDFGDAHYDDIRIYNRALSATEVKAIYEFEKP